MSEQLQLSTEQIIRLREKELELLRLFISVCEQLNLNYFAVEGTLLGAVRHKGFIPWDDDIDVGMKRSDYELFLQKAPAMLPDGFFLQTEDSDPAYAQCFAKLRNVNTVFLETTSKNLPIQHGIYIDIFPFDYYPDGRISALLFDFEKLLIRYRVREIYYIPSDSKLSAANLIRKAISFISKCRFRSVKSALDYQEILIRRWSGTKRVINNGSPWKNKERFDATWLNDLTEVEFEGLRIKAPKRYDEYLRHVYGDYMTMPPMEKRVPHHYISAIDFEKG